MLAEGILIGLIVGFLLKGKIKPFETIEIRFWYLIVGSGLLEIGANYIRKNEVGPIWEIVDQYVLILKIIIYGLIIFALIMNLNFKGMKTTLLGVILNAIVVIANGGRMPVEIDSIMDKVAIEAIEVLKSGSDLAHTVLVESTRFKVLGDIIHVLKPYPLPKSISVGDILMSLGIMIFIIFTMKQRVTVNRYRY